MATVSVSETVGSGWFTKIQRVNAMGLVILMRLRALAVEAHWPHS